MIIANELIPRLQNKYQSSLASGEKQIFSQQNCSWSVYIDSFKLAEFKYFTISNINVVSVKLIWMAYNVYTWGMY